jgi:hypothetical protein
MKNLSKSRPWRIGALIAVVFGLVVLGCSGKPNPKNTIMDLFTALHADDTTLVRQSVDLGRAWRSVSPDLKAPEDSLLADIMWDERLLTALIDEGKLRTRWIKTQVVIGKTEMFADSANVEVSFIDRDTRVQFYNKMALVFRNGAWKIVAFSI